MKHPKTHLKIRVMAEYGSSGIWGFSEKGMGIFRHGMMEHYRLKLPRELSDRFDRWILNYEDMNLSDNTNKLDSETFNAEGRYLATELKKFLGRHRHVEYQGEDKDGKLLQSVVIP